MRVFDDVVQSLLVIEEHGGFFQRLSRCCLFLQQQSLGLQQGICVALDLRGLPAQIHGQTLQLLFVLRRGQFDDVVPEPLLQTGESFMLCTGEQRSLGKNAE